jgi:hypothetical protein
MRYGTGASVLMSANVSVEPCCCTVSVEGATMRSEPEQMAKLDAGTAGSEHRHEKEGPRAGSSLTQRDHDRRGEPRGRGALRRGHCSIPRSPRARSRLRPRARGARDGLRARGAVRGGDRGGSKGRGAGTRLPSAPRRASGGSTSWREGKATVGISSRRWRRPRGGHGTSHPSCSPRSTPPWTRRRRRFDGWNGPLESACPLFPSR